MLKMLAIETDRKKRKGHIGISGKGNW